MRLFLLLGLLATLLAGGLAAWNVKAYLDTPAQTPGREVTITIPKGQSLGRIADYLEHYDVVDARALVVWAKLKGVESKLRSGRFRLHSGWTPERILRELVSGREVLVELYVPEGAPWWEVAERVEKAGLGSFKSFKAAIRDPEILKEYGIPAKSAEGYLYPETYYLPLPPKGKESDATPVVKVLLNQSAKVLDNLFPNGRPEPEELQKLVILASIVEKETSLHTERATIAGVYANRLQKGMRLQADPTVIYGIGPSFSGNLHKSDLQNRKNRYNTYRRKGLPPGPICSPSGAALAAAANPRQHNYLFFVSTNRGRHIFSTNLADHNAAVRKYQLRRRR